MHYARIGELGLIRGVFPEVLVPEAVWREVVEEGWSRPGSIELVSASWIHRVSVAESLLVERLRTELDPGEAEAIALAHEYGGTIPLIVDERRGRRVARSLGLRIVGSAGLLISAKERGLLTEIEPTMRRLVESGLRVSDQVVARILEAANE